MSGWSYDEVGQFGSRREAEDWARRNDLDPRDLHVREQGGSVDVGVKRSATSGRRFDDSHNGRRDGFFG